MPLHFKSGKLQCDTLILVVNHLRDQLIESFYVTNFWVLSIWSEMILLLFIWLANTKLVSTVWINYLIVFTVWINYLIVLVFFKTYPKNTIIYLFSLKSILLYSNFQLLRVWLIKILKNISNWVLDSNYKT